MNKLAEMMLKFVLYNEEPTDSNICSIFNYCRTLPRLDLVTYEETEEIKQQYILLMQNAVHTVSKDFLLVALVITNEQLMNVYKCNEEVCKLQGFWFSEVLDYAITI